MKRDMLFLSLEKNLKEHLKFLFNYFPEEAIVDKVNSFVSAETNPPGKFDKPVSVNSLLNPSRSVQRVGKYLLCVFHRMFCLFQFSTYNLNLAKPPAIESHLTLEQIQNLQLQQQRIQQSRNLKMHQQQAFVSRLNNADTSSSVHHLAPLSQMSQHYIQQQQLQQNNPQAVAIVQMQQQQQQSNHQNTTLAQIQQQQLIQQQNHFMNSNGNGYHAPELQQYYSQPVFANIPLSAGFNAGVPVAVKGTNQMITLSPQQLLQYQQQQHQFALQQQHQQQLQQQLHHQQQQQQQQQVGRVVSQQQYANQYQQQHEEISGVGNKRSFTDSALEQQALESESLLTSKAKTSEGHE
jgi:hypothetical protein